MDFAIDELLEAKKADVLRILKGRPRQSLRIQTPVGRVVLPEESVSATQEVSRLDRAEARKPAAIKN